MLFCRTIGPPLRPAIGHEIQPICICDPHNSGSPARPLFAPWTETMPKKRAKKRTFSTVKAVKANARVRVGQPKPERVLPNTAREVKRGRKHPQTLSKLLSEEQ